MALNSLLVTMSGGFQWLILHLLQGTLLAVQNPPENNDLSFVQWSSELCHLCGLGLLQETGCFAKMWVLNICAVIVSKISSGKVGGRRWLGTANF